MSKPCKGDELRVKRVVRYLQKFPRLVVKYPWQAPTSQLDIYTDSDWGGCIRTRKNTSGGVLMRGSHCISHWSRTQQLVSLSPAEAELNASIRAGQEGLCLSHVLSVLENPHGVHLYGDSSAAQGIAQRTGCGKVKHLSIRQLWVQERVELGDLKVHKIPRAVNLSDALTHHWHQSEGSVQFQGMSLVRMRSGYKAAG